MLAKLLSLIGGMFGSKPAPRPGDQPAPKLIGYDIGREDYSCYVEARTLSDGSYQIDRIRYAKPASKWLTVNPYP